MEYLSCLTFPLSSAPYGTFSNAPVSAPSWSPPRDNCLICAESDWTSAVETGCTAGVKDERSKLAGESGSSWSMLIVRQLMFDMLRVDCVSQALRVTQLTCVYVCGA